jgi:putative sigma-54 modulation protein
VTLRVDKPLHCAEATVTLPGSPALHADASGPDMYAAIDLLADKLDRLLVKHKEKQVDGLRRNESAARSGDFA